MFDHKNKPEIIFVHGILGFDSIGFPKLGLSVDYFRKLPKRLDSLPVNAHFPALPAVGTIAQRAQVLAKYIEALGADSVHLVGHSMGGLDCRYAAAHLDPAKRISSVTSIASPHLGTPLADWIVDGRGIFPALARKIMAPGIYDLTTDAMHHFNDAVPDRDDVRYSSYAGVRPIDEMPLWYRPWTRRVSNVKGPNDSQVPVSSARWGHFVKQSRADHFEMAGWSFALPSRTNQRPFDHIRFYTEIVERLIDS